MKTYLKYGSDVACDLSTTVMESRSKDQNSDKYHSTSNDL